MTIDYVLVPAIFFMSTYESVKEIMTWRKSMKLHIYVFQFFLRSGTNSGNIYLCFSWIIAKIILYVTKIRHENMSQIYVALMIFRDLHNIEKLAFIWAWKI